MRTLPVGRLPVLLWMLVLYATFVVHEHSFCHGYPSASDWYTRIFYPFLSLEHLRRSWLSIHLTHRHWHSGRSDVTSFPSCIRLGIAASRYNIIEAACVWSSCEWVLLTVAVWTFWISENLLAVLASDAHKQPLKMARVQFMIFCWIGTLWATVGHF
jgi:hypothetical protein